MVTLLTNIIGYSATVVATLIMLPQLIKTIKTKRVEDISMMMLIIFMVNNILWVIYGILSNGNPVIVANIIVFIIVLSVFVLKIKYKVSN